ncbi:ferrochelatase [Simiduia curdlanivorans]|uniref:Ferrochelatase n=1 Tax=Simiduia curdlanivorans TaxID=1492769 RepID=A0ABV8VBI4_9GAMM|nr:ferrochelatase [Simiduia curdlanivorans]MDN3639595.1 ferrochelatase [Simiduia curdlanivorans]
MKSSDAVILINLGTPERADAKSVRKFLREFLWDPRVVEIPRLLWWPILNGIILPFRPKRVAHAYQSIWTDQGSPLKVITERLADKLQATLSRDQGAAAPKIVCAYSYGKQSIAKQVQSLSSQGYDRFLLLPLYPQYSATTTGSVYDQWAEIIRSHRDIPDIRIHKSYSARPDFIAGLVQSIQAHWQAQGRSEKLLFSFHGIPQRNVDLGDPYEAQCLQTARDVADSLGLESAQWQVSFQSRLGKAEWLKPYTDKLLAQWGAESVESVDVICPAFSIDCLETLEEIQVENRDLFLASGGKAYHYIPCLNDSDAQVFLLSNIVLESFA